MTCPNLKRKQELADDTLLFLTPVNSASPMVSLDGLPISCQVPSLVWRAATQAGIYHFIAQHWKQPQLSVPPLCKIILQPLFSSSVFHRAAFRQVSKHHQQLLSKVRSRNMVPQTFCLSLTSKHGILHLPCCCCFEGISPNSKSLAKVPK